MASAAARAFAAASRISSWAFSGATVRAEKRLRPRLTATVTQPGISSSISLHAQWSPATKTNGTP